MQEIASAIQEGARAYLNRQYKTIAIVGLVVLVIVSIALGVFVGLGYLIGATLSGIAGYVGMLISVQANVRTAEASRKGLAQGLSIAFKSGAVTGLLVAGLALLSITVYYFFLISINIEERELINALIGLGFGASLISISFRTPITKSLPLTSIVAPTPSLGTLAMAIPFLILSNAEGYGFASFSVVTIFHKMFRRPFSNPSKRFTPWKALGSFINPKRQLRR